MAMLMGDAGREMAKEMIASARSSDGSMAAIVSARAPDLGRVQTVSRSSRTR